MKSRVWIAALLLALVATPTLAAKVFIDYDTKADLESYKTFAYNKSAEGTVKDPLMDERVVTGLRNMLSEGELSEVDSSPDLWATYTVTTKERTEYSTTSMGYGYGGGYGRYGAYGYGGMGTMGMSSSTTTAHTYTDGTLIVDIWDAKTKELVWRGSATDTIKANPSKVAKQIDSFYKQMISKWDKTIAKAKKDAQKAAKKK